MTAQLSPHIVQYIALVIFSILLIENIAIAYLLLLVGAKKYIVPVFYLMLVSLHGAVYYIAIIFFGAPGHFWSALLRLHSVSTLSGIAGAIIIYLIDILGKRRGTHE